MLAHVILNVLSVHPIPIEMKHINASSSDCNHQHILSRLLIDDILENQTKMIHFRIQGEYLVVYFVDRHPLRWTEMERKMLNIFRKTTGVFFTL